MRKLYITSGSERQRSDKSTALKEVETSHGIAVAGNRMNKYNFPFSVGEQVFPIAEKIKKNYTVCPACEGTGRVALKDGLMYKCPNCEGSGKKRTLQTKVWSVKYPLFGVNMVNEIVVTVSADGITEEYVVGGSAYEAKDLFLTEQAALEECKCRNGEVD